MHDNTKLRFILGSASPRRRELLAHYRIPFEIDVPDVDESSSTLDPILYVQEIALKKACAIAERHPTLSGVILCSDTTVSFQGQILGKPQDIQEARTHLKLLSGQTHQVYTALALVKCFQGVQEYFCEVAQTHVEFLTIPEILLENYLASGDSLDKAGSYGIQGPAQIFVKSVQGSYSNVVGFPHHLFYEMMSLKLFPDSKDSSWLSFF
jgi:septum formation protein